jgi:hypothetical protein
MPDRPTLDHTRLTGLELGGKPVNVTSAELVKIQHWLGDEPAQLEWEVQARTMDQWLRDGVHSLVISAGERQFRGRGIATISGDPGIWVIRIVGMDPLTEIKAPPAAAAS